MTVFILTAEDIELCRHYAKHAEIGGVSAVRQADRLDKLADDQFIGQCGNLALSYLLTGQRDLYIATREYQDLHPHLGDLTDLLGLKVDAKTSRMRAGSDHLYHLYVREREYHEDVAYYLILMKADRDDFVNIVGWAYGFELPPAVDGRRELSMTILQKC